MVVVEHHSVRGRHLEPAVHTFPTIQFALEKSLPTWSVVGGLEARLTEAVTLGLVEVVGIDGQAEATEAAHLFSLWEEFLAIAAAGGVGGLA